MWREKELKTICRPFSLTPPVHVTAFEADCQDFCAGIKKKREENPSKSIGVKKRLPRRSQLRAPEVCVFTERTSSLVRGQTHTHILVSRSAETEITFDPI